MGKNRKLPFGYTMEYGRVVVCPEERKWVEDIFSLYTSGASFGDIAEYMGQSGIPYEQSKVWNKNMIARILGDSRYTGEKSFPVIINLEMFEQAAALRSTRGGTIQKTEAQKMLRRKCGFPLNPYIEQEVLYLLNCLAENPDKIMTPEDHKSKTNQIDTLKQELERMIGQLPVDEERTREKLMEVAVVMYEIIDPREYETYRMQRLFRNERPRAELDSHLIAMNVSAVFVDSNGRVRIKLKNDQIIERGE